MVVIKIYVVVLLYASALTMTSQKGIKRNPTSGKVSTHEEALSGSEQEPVDVTDDGRLAPAATSSRAPADRCLFKRCYPGERCVLDGVTGRGVCVCRRHCKPVDKPLCGTDGEYYPNRCEMHKAACLSGGHVYDARHKDCFSKRSTCDSNDLKLFMDFLLQFHQSTTALSRHLDVTDNKPSLRTKRNLVAEVKNEAREANQQGGNHVAVTLGDEKKVGTKRERVTTSFMTTTSIAYIPYGDDGAFPNQLVGDDVITNDVRGEAVKRIFRFLDLDEDGLVGSEEVYEVSLMEDLDSALPPPCSLYHLIQRGDGNQDGGLDAREMLKMYNITILRLPESEKIVLKRAVYGSSYTLQCGIHGETMPQWRRHGYNLSSQGGSNIRVDGSLLHFDDVHPRDAGNYTCHAQMHTNIFQTIRLSVMSRPQVQVYPTMQHRVTGSSVTISCHVTGVPIPQITWLLDGKVLDDSNEIYVFMGNNSQLHMNNAQPSDSAAYTCLATSAAGQHEEVATVIIHDEEDQVAPRNVEETRKSAYFVFHEDGISLADPKSCNVVRNIRASESVPGLLRQNKLCRATPDDGVHKCKWSQAVAVGSRFVYAAQPEENRVVVVDLLLQRVLEVIATDAMPTSLHYVPSIDQVFVLCWVDMSRDRSTLLVIYAASVLGAHSATQMQPLDGGRTIDQPVMNFFVPPEGVMNAQSRHGLVSHRDQQSVFKLNLATLLYDDDVIDLHAYDCVPHRLSYQPIGGLLTVTCEQSLRSVTVEYSSGRIISTQEESDVDQQFVSTDTRHVVFVKSHDQTIEVFNVTESGDLVESINLRTNFRVSDVAFVPKLTSAEAATVYFSSTVQGDIMYLDPATGRVQVIGGLSKPVDQTEIYWEIPNRPLVASSWYDRHIATSSVDQLVIIDVSTNDVKCRLGDINKASTIVWADGPL